MASPLFTRRGDEMKTKELHEMLHQLGGDVEVVVAVNETGYSDSVVKLKSMQEAVVDDYGEGMFEVFPADEPESPRKVLLLVVDDAAAYEV